MKIKDSEKLLDILIAVRAILASGINPARITDADKLDRLHMQLYSREADGLVADYRPAALKERI